MLVASGVYYDDFTPPFLLLSVSHTSDLHGDWWVWAFPESGEAEIAWPDHPSLGVDAHALYVSANLFRARSANPAVPCFGRDPEPATAPRAQAVLPHQPRHPLAAQPLAAFVQLGVDSGAAVPLPTLRVRAS